MHWLRSERGQRSTPTNGADGSLEQWSHYSRWTSICHPVIHVDSNGPQKQVFSLTGSVVCSRPSSLSHLNWYSHSWITVSSLSPEVQTAAQGGGTYYCFLVVFGILGKISGVFQCLEEQRFRPSSSLTSLRRVSVCWRLSDSRGEIYPLSFGVGNLLKPCATKRRVSKHLPLYCRGFNTPHLQSSQ